MLSKETKDFANIILQKATDTYEEYPLSDEIGSAIHKFVLTEVVRMISEAMVEMEEI